MKYRNIFSNEVVEVTNMNDQYVDYVRTTPLCSYKTDHFNLPVKIEGSEQYEFFKPYEVFMVAYRALKN